jgi:DNA segregation ATPase FtsK/SpoIIIE, S-DNA-T family
LVNFTPKFKMAENTYKSDTFKKPEKEKKVKPSKSKAKLNFSFLQDPRLALAFGFFIIIVSIYLFTAFLSYLFTGKADQSVVEALLNTSLLESGKEAENWLGLYGAVTSHFIVFKWLGVSAFFLPPLFFLIGFNMVFKRELLPIFSVFILSAFSGLWLSLLLGYLTHSLIGVNEVSFLSGGLGYELAKISDALFGWGTFLILVLSLFIFIIYYFNVTAINAFQVKNPKPIGNDALIPVVPASEEEKPAYTDDRDHWPTQAEDELANPVLFVKNIDEVKPAIPELQLEVERRAN